MDKLLIVEDMQSLRDQLKWRLGGEYLILEGADRHQAMELFLTHTPRVVLLDLGLPPDPDGASEGLLCLDWMTETRPSAKIVVMTGDGDKETGCQAIGRGAYDYHVKPVDIGALKIIIGRAFHLSRTEEQKSRLQHALEQSSAGIEGIASQLSAMKELLASLTAAEVLGPQMTGRGAQSLLPGLGPMGQLATDPARGGGRMLQGDEGAPQGNLTLREVRDMVEKGMITAAFGNCGGNMAKASEMLGVSRPALYDLMKKHGLSKPAHRE